MNRRKSKKVLIGLGSTVAFGSVGLVAGVGIKSIVEANVFNDNQFNLAQAKSVEEIPKFNVAEKGLFPIDTGDFAREFHFGNTWRGQTLTPWGWLGVGSNGTNKRKIFLTGWNGEILWVNTDFPTNIGNRTDYDVYDMKYDWNTDLLFVVRTGNSNGLWGNNNITIDVIQGSTGVTRKKGILNSGQISDFTREAKKFIEEKFEKRNTDHLFTLDVISSNHDSNSVYLTYSPNFMQLAEKDPIDDKDIRQIVSMETILANWEKFQLTIKVSVQSNGTLSINLLDQKDIWGGDTNSGGNSSFRDILWKNGTGKWEYKYYEGNNSNSWAASKGSLLTNPFNTISENGHLITHFIFADSKGNTFHLYYANKKTGNGDWNKYVGSERLAKEGDPDKSDVEDVNMPVLNKNEKEGKFYWSNILRWDKRTFSNANLRINRNMFEPDFVTFAYPYAAPESNTWVFPTFNVASIMIDYKTGKIKTKDFARPFLKSVVYQFGRKNFEYWLKNKDSYPSNNGSGDVSGIKNEPYPWPENANDPNWLIKFNRLISVSPFDNTIIIASTSPFRAKDDIKLSTSKNNKYASFWIGTNQLLFNNGTAGKLPVMRPFLISNTQGGSLGKTPINSRMIDAGGDGILSNLYSQGFTFDLSSLNTSSDGKNTKLNLYFNQTGSGKNDVYRYLDDDNKTMIAAPMRTTKIGLLDSPFYDERDHGDFKNSWATSTDQIFGNFGLIQNYTAVIGEDNFSSLIHSRAKLDDWWKRSWFNVNNGANGLKADGKVLNPIYNKDEEHPVAYKYDKSLKNPVLRGNASAELLSNWKTGGTNFNRLEVKQGLLKVVNKVDKDQNNKPYQNKLFIELSFNPNDSMTRNKYMPIFHETDPNIRDRKRQRLFWKKEFEIYNPSYQIFTSWSTHFRISGLPTGVQHLVPSVHWEDKDLKEWIDARKNPNEASFGKSNNMSINGKSALRVVFRIKNPATTGKPEWWKPDDKFFEWYPATTTDLLSGETIFKDNLINFLKWKNQNIDLNYGATKTQGLGLANLTIEAGLQLNPKIRDDASVQKYPIYKVNDNRFVIPEQTNGNTRMVIYEDLYKGNRVVYKQEEKEYTKLNQGGFKSPELNDSWTQDGLNNLKKDVISIESLVNDLRDNLVRPTPGDQTPVIKAKYTDKNKNKIKVELANKNQEGWFNNVFNSYNFGLNLFASFEYAKKSKPDEWIAFEGQNNINNKNTKYVVDKANAATTGWEFNVKDKDVIKVRYHLIESPTKGSFPVQNDFVEWKNFEKDNFKLISNEAFIQDKYIQFEKVWISNEKLISVNNTTLDGILASDVTAYESKIIEKIAAGNGNNSDLDNDKLKEILEFKYYINNNNVSGMVNLSAGELVNKLKELLGKREASDDGAFSLWDEGKKDQTKIYVKLKVKEKYKEQYVLVENNSEQPDGVDETVRVNIKTKINLSAYFNWLKSEKLVARKTVDGEMSDVKIPTSSFGSSVQFSNRTFEQMQMILSKLGIKFVFKQWNSTTNAWDTNWIDDLSKLTKYNTANPAIMVSLKWESDFNVELWVENQNITTSSSPWSGIEVKLQLPKTVSINIEEIKKSFLEKKPITGDTHKINITNVESFILETINDIIQKNNANNTSGTNNFDNLRNQLKFEFKLGSSDWKEINDLSKWIDAQNEAKVDINSNLLVIKIKLVDPSNANEFEIPVSTRTEINLYEDDNEEIKKWIHGLEYESALDSITISGDKTDINYSYPEKITDIINNKEERLIFQWADASTNNRNDDWKDVSQDRPPTNINDGKIKKIKFKIVLNSSKKSFLYGPESSGNQKIKVIDLSHLKTLIKVDSNWFKEELVIPDDSPIKINNNLFVTKLNEWEQKILNRIKDTDQEIIKKIKIKYEFNNDNNLDSQKLFDAIQTRVNQNDDIIQLWDGVSDGTKIQAKFTVDQNDESLIQFIDNNDQPIGHNDNKLKGDINTKNIQTDVNLINYINLLTETEIQVIPAASGADLGIIDGIKPPSNDRGGLFNGKTWDEISRKLEDKKIKILFSSDKGNWSSANEIKKYDPKKGTLFLSIENKSSNLNVEYKQNESPILPNSDIKTKPLIVRLKVTKLITIEQTDWDDYIKDSGISGDTKNINIETNKIETFINNIKQRHVNESGNSDFQKVNIKLKFSLEKTNKNYLESGLFKDNLSKETKDQTTRILYAKFFIENDTKNEWQLSGIKESKIFDENTTNPLKIFIHDEGIFNKLSNPSVSGTNADLKWSWTGLTVNPNSGIIEQPDKNKVLKVEYSSNKKDWSTNQIKSVSAGTTSVWIRLNFTDPNRFVFEVSGNINKEIEVRLDNIKQILNVSTNSLTSMDLSKTEINISNLTSETFTTWEKEVKDQMTINNGSINNWQDLIEFEYSLQEASLFNKWFNSVDLIKKLKEWENNNSGDTFGIMQLWNQNSGKKILTRLKLKNDANSTKYELIVDGKNASTTTKTVKTNNVFTTINFASVYSWLQKIKLDINRTSSNEFNKINWPQVSAADSKFNNKTWDQVVSVLDKLNIKVMYQDIDKNDQPKSWLEDYNKMNSFGSNATFNMMFELKNPTTSGKNIKLNLSAKETIEANKPKSQVFSVSLKAPKFIKIDQTVIANFKAKEPISGNTKYLDVKTELITQLIKDIKDKNQNISNINDANLKVFFSMGQNPKNNEWHELDKFKSEIEKIKIDQKSNQINMVFWVVNNNENEPDFVTDSNKIILKSHTSPEQVEANKAIKYFINDNQWERWFDEIQVFGTTDKLTWSWGNNLTPLVILEQNSTLVQTNKDANHCGLHFEWTSLESAKAEDSEATQNDLTKGWTKTKPDQIDSSINKIWVRAVAQPGFVYGPAEKSTTTPIKKHQIDLSRIKRIVKLESKWLQEIKATGNLIELTIDETAARKKLTENNVLPPNELENLIFEYSIDGNTWKDQAGFKSFLKTNDGKGANGFILKREDIKVRFGLKQGVANDKYGFNIDGELITNHESFKKYYKQLIDDNQTINTAVLGVINTKFIRDFDVKNFSIFGSNNKPRLNVKKEQELLKAFNPYASSNIFKIEITTTYSNNNWDWSDPKEIWTNGTFISNLSDLALTIPANKKVAIRLKTIDNKKYKVKNNSTNNANLEEEKILDISSNVHITFEIENPFVKANKVLSIWTRDDKKKAKWNQGEGEFRILASDKTATDPDLQTDASKFLSESNEPNSDKLELIYKVFETEPTQQEIEHYKKPATINNFSDQNGWKSFDFSADPENNNEYWSKGLNLKVGNFLMVGLRVKKQFATQTDPFVLKDNENSVLIPVTADGKKPGRVAGFKVDPDRIPIVESSIQLESTKENLLGGYLDGYTLLKSLILETDDKSTIEGVDLKVSLFNDFYRDKTTKKILISGTGSKLVKREKTGNKGNAYVDDKGQQLTDEQDQPIYMYTDPATGRLTEPTEENAATRTKNLLHLNGGNFMFPIITDQEEINQFSLFRNQKIEVSYIAKEGEKLDGLPDFELTDQKKVDLQKNISPQIKFPVENPSNISYLWQQEDFASNVLEYESSSEGITETVSGFSKVKTPLKIQRMQSGSTTQEVTGPNGKASAIALEQMLKNDFSGQLEFAYTYLKKSGSQTVTKNSADIYNLDHLENGDKITLTIQAKADDLIYADAPRPLVLNVDGLLTDAPKQERLQFLRVEQRGNLNGEGSFRLLINDPTKPETNESLLKGWKFLIRVWSKDKKSIKINWTEDQTNLVNLENGDKVEWKLVDQNGNPVRDAYYNTVAGDHQQGDDGNIIYKFQQVNYDNGPTSKKVIKDEIGKYPSKNEENKYPESSGFVIGGLKEKILRFDLTQFAFEKIIATLEPRYKGINGHGVLNFNEKFFEGQWWVNHDGDVYQKTAATPATFASQDNVEQPAEITLDQFFANTTFYTENPATNPLQMGWHFSSNETEVDNYLFNNNQLWARFDVVQPDPSGTYQDSDGRFLIAALPQVSNLKIISDEMSPLWWILIALGFIATFGTLFIFYWKQRHKKLKVPKFK